MAVAGRGAVDRLHKPQVYIDLSGWSPKYFPPQLVQHANTQLKRKVLFGTDYPLITPERWLADFEKIDIRRRSPAADTQSATPSSCSSSALEQTLDRSRNARRSRLAGTLVGFYTRFQIRFATHNNDYRGTA